MQELVQIFVRLLLKPNCVPLSSSNICGALALEQAQLFSEFGYFRAGGSNFIISHKTVLFVSVSYSHLDFQYSSPALE